MFTATALTAAFFILSFLSPVEAYTSSSNGTASRLARGAIAGIAVGCVVFFLICIGLCCCCLVMFRRRRAGNGGMSGGNVAGPSMTTTAGGDAQPFGFGRKNGGGMEAAEAQYPSATYRGGESYAPPPGPPPAHYP